MKGAGSFVLGFIKTEGRKTKIAQPCRDKRRRRSLAAADEEVTPAKKMRLPFPTQNDASRRFNREAKVAPTLGRVKNERTAGTVRVLYACSRVVPILQRRSS